MAASRNSPARSRQGNLSKYGSRNSQASITQKRLTASLSTQRKISPGDLPIINNTKISLHFTNRR